MYQHLIQKDALGEELCDTLFQLVFIKGCFVPNFVGNGFQQQFWKSQNVKCSQSGKGQTDEQWTKDEQNLNENFSAGHMYYLRIGLTPSSPLRNIIFVSGILQLFQHKLSFKELFTTYSV